MGQPHALRLSYNSSLADPHPILGGTATILFRAAVPPTVSVSLSVAGVGHFIYNDCVVPPPGDAETVTKGHIFIH